MIEKLDIDKYFKEIKIFGASMTKITIKEGWIKINEIIDFLNDKKNFHIFPDKDCEICWRESLKDKVEIINNVLPKSISFSELPGKHDKQEEPCGDFIPNEMQNGFIERNDSCYGYDTTKVKESKSWQKKLEEADNLEIISLKAKDILSSFEKESIWQLKECNKFKIDLYKQVIEELIKDNEEKNKFISTWCNQLCLNCEVNDPLECKECNFTSFRLKQLQQKQPPEECIEWGNNFLKRCKYGFQEGDKEMIIKLLKYFKEIK